MLSTRFCKWPIKTTITVPQVDFNLLKELAKKFGWVIQTEKKSGIEEALEDVKAGRVYHAKDAHDLIKQCLEWESKLPPSYKSHKLHGNLERLIVENSATSIALFKYFIMLLQPLHSANEIDSSTNEVVSLTQRSRIFNPAQSYL